MQTLNWIHGMRRGGRARTFQALLARLPGVRRVEVSRREGRARLLVNGAEATPARLTELNRPGF